MANATQFRVVLEGVKLPKAATDRINKAIQQTVASELAALDLNKGDQLYHINPEWLGFILRQLNAREVKGTGIDFGQEEKQFAGGG